MPGNLLKFEQLERRYKCVNFIVTNSNIQKQNLLHFPVSKFVFFLKCLVYFIQNAREMEKRRRVDRGKKIIEKLTEKLGWFTHLIVGILW